MDPGLVLLLVWLNIPPIFGLYSPSSFEKMHNGMFALVIVFCHSCTNFSLVLQKGRLKNQALNFNITIQHSMLQAQLLAASVCSVCFVCRLGKRHNWSHIFRFSCSATHAVQTICTSSTDWSSIYFTVNNKGKTSRFRRLLQRSKIIYILAYGVLSYYSLLCHFIFSGLWDKSEKNHKRVTYNRCSGFS